jgi:hypothetical protein
MIRDTAVGLRFGPELALGAGGRGAPARNDDEA